MAAAQAAENHGWVRLDLILSMRDTYINSNLNPLTKFTSSSRSTKFKDILPWNISQVITKAIPISTRIVISYAMKWSILLWSWWKVSGNWDSNMIRISNGGKAIAEGILVSEERNKSQRARLWESQFGIRVGKLTIWVRSFEIIEEFTRLISSTRIGKPVLMMDIKVSKNKNISRWVDRENLIYVRWNRIKNRAQSWRRWSIEEKEVRHWVK